MFRVNVHSVLSRFLVFLTCSLLMETSAVRLVVIVILAFATSAVFW